MSARYTIDQLVALRDSPLVKKPDELPSIEQWLEQSSQDQQQQPAPNQANQPNQRKGRNGNQNGQRDETNTPMGNFSSQRPSLLQTRHTSRSSVAGSGTSLTHADLSRVATNLVRTLQADGMLEDIVLGPPKTSFASSRNHNRVTSESTDKLPPTTEGANEEDAPPPPRSRFLREGVTPKTAVTLKSDRDTWRTSRNLAEEEDRNGDREKPHGRRDRNLDSQEDSGMRRNGYGHGQRADQRWSRDAETRPMGKLGEGQRGGWRERERAKQESTFGGGGGSSREAHNERDPEWMDEPADNDASQMKTVEDFEKWKQSMKKKNQPASAAAAADHVASPDVAGTPIKSAQTSTDLATPVLQDSGFDKLFGTWGQASRPAVESPAEAPAPKTAKAPATAKGKSSRFASMFAPKEEPLQYEEHASPLLFKQPGPNGSSEDKEGFARIMAMLGKPTLDGGDGGDGSSPAQAGGLAAFFASAAPQPQPQPEQLQESQQSQQQQQQQQHHQQARQQHRQPQQEQSRHHHLQQNRPPSFPQTPQDEAVASFVTKKPPSARPGSGMEAFMSPQLPNDKPARFPPQLSNPSSNVASPNPSHMRSESGSHPQQYPQFPFLDQRPPSQLRHMQQTPESANVQQIIAGDRAQKPKGALNKDSEFLLNLISQKAKTSNTTATQQNKQVSTQPQQQQDRSQPPQGRPDDFQLFLDQPPQQSQPPQQPHRKSTQPPIETHAPKPQQPHRAPGQLEEQLFKSGIPHMINMGPPSDRERVDQPQPRGQQQRVPPGFFEDPAMMLQQHQMQQQQQQRELQAQQQQLQGRKQPQARVPSQMQGQGQGQSQQERERLERHGGPEHMFQNGPPPGFPLGPQQQPPLPNQQNREGRENGGSEPRMPQPPPGFNPNLRHPPGFAGIPGIFQPPTQQQQQQQQPPSGGPAQQGQPLPGRGMREADFLALMQSGLPPPGGLPPQGMGYPRGGLPDGLQGPPRGMNLPDGMQMPPPPPHQNLPGMVGPPPPGFFNGLPPPPGFFNGMPPPHPPPPGFPGMGMPGNGMISPPGLAMGARGGIGSPIEGQGQMMGMPPGFGLAQQQQQQQQQRRQ